MLKESIHDLDRAAIGDNALDARSLTMGFDVKNVD
jgi:hypothetical protein